MDWTASTRADDEAAMLDRADSRSATRATRAGPLALWWRLTALPASAGPGLAEDMSLRRSRWASILLLGTFALGLIMVAAELAGHLLFGAALSIGYIVEPLGIAGSIAGILLNRRGHLRGVGIVLVALADLPVAAALLAAPSGTLDPAQIPALYFLAAAVLVAAVLLPPRAVFPVATVNALLAAAALIFLPRSPAFAQTFSRPDALAVLIAQVIAFQFLVAGVAVALAATGRQAETRASDAESVAEVVAREAERTRDDERRRYQLEEGLRQLLAALGQLARGETQVHAPARAGDAMLLTHLWSAVEELAVRLRRHAASEEALEHERRQVAALLLALREARGGRPPAWPAPIGVPADELVAEIASGALAPAAPAAAPRSPRRVDSAVPSVPSIPSDPSATKPSSGVLPGSGPFPRPGSGVLPRLESGPLPPKPGSGVLPHLASGPLPPKPGSGILPPLPGSGSLPPMSGSGPLPPKPGSGTLPPYVGSGPLFRPGSGALPSTSKPQSDPLRASATGSLHSLGDSSLLARLHSGPLPPKPGSGSLPDLSAPPPAPGGDASAPTPDTAP